MADKGFKPGSGYTQQDWDDVESPELTDEELAQMRPFAEVFPDLAASILRSQEAAAAPTELVSLRLSGEVIEKYKAGGPDWQARIDADLRRINNIK